MKCRTYLTIVLIAFSLSTLSCEVVETTTSQLDVTTDVGTDDTTEPEVGSTGTVIEDSGVMVTTISTDQVTIESIESTTYSDPESIAIELAPREKGNAVKAEAQHVAVTVDKKSTNVTETIEVSSTAIPVVNTKISTKIPAENQATTDYIVESTTYIDPESIAVKSASKGEDTATKDAVVDNSVDKKSGNVTESSTAIPVVNAEISTKAPIEIQATTDSAVESTTYTNPESIAVKFVAKEQENSVKGEALVAVPIETKSVSSTAIPIVSAEISTTTPVENQHENVTKTSQEDEEEDEESSTESTTTEVPDENDKNDDSDSIKRIVLKTFDPIIEMLNDQRNKMAGTVPKETVMTTESGTDLELTTVEPSVIRAGEESTFVPEMTTENIIQTTTGTAVDDATTPELANQVDDVVRMEPQLVRIFDPSVDVEATTYLAEANQQTEPSVTTESLLQQVEELIEVAQKEDGEEEGETLTTTTTDDLLATMTTQLGATESGTESFTESTNTEVMSETTALPLPLSSSTKAASTTTPSSTKKRNYKGYKVYRVILPTEESVQRILSMEDEPGVEFWADPRLLLRPRGLFVTSAADIMVAPKIVPQIEEIFRQARLTYTVLIDDVQTSIVKENPSGSSFARSQSGANGKHRLTWERYHRLADINSFVDYLKEMHADWVEVVPIGKSSQGRPIQVIKVSRPTDTTRMETSQKKKAILIDAGMHANEWITPAALTWMVNELVENAKSYSCILDRFDWYFVPMVNPDGYEYSHAVDRMWRKTRRNYTSQLLRSGARKLRVDDETGDQEQCVGADINRNFEFYWRKGGSSANVCSPSFAGMKPFSEPESRALANFMLKQRSRIAMYISLHSYSQMWLLPWGFAETRPEDFSQLYSLAKIGARALQQVHNTSYLIGSVPDLLALASGTSQDWAKGVAGVHYSYTLEMRDAGQQGMILPAQQIIPTAEETWAGIYAAAIELAHRYYDQLPSCSVF